MPLRRILRPSNRRIRIAVGLLLIALFFIQCTQSSNANREMMNMVVTVDRAAVEAGSQELGDRLEHLAKTDHIALLELCKQNYRDAYSEYTCTFIKQERIDGQLRDEQWIDAKFMAEPFSVALDWVKNPPIGEALIYVEDKYNGKMLVKPRGFLSTLVGTVKREPDGPDAMKNTLRPVTKFGFANSLESLLSVYRDAEQAGELTQGFAGYAEVAGRKCIVLERYLPPEDEYPAKKTLTYVDVESLLPICVEGWNWQDELCCRYLYRDIDFSVDLKPEDFTPEANDMKAP